MTSSSPQAASGARHTRAKMMAAFIALRRSVVVSLHDYHLRGAAPRLGGFLAPVQPPHQIGLAAAQSELLPEPAGIGAAAHGGHQLQLAAHGCQTRFERETAGTPASHRLNGDHYRDQT